MIGEFDLASTDRLLTTTRSVRRRLDFARPVPTGRLVKGEVRDKHWPKAETRPPTSAR